MDFIQPYLNPANEINVKRITLVNNVYNSTEYEFNTRLPDAGSQSCLIDLSLMEKCVRNFEDLMREIPIDGVSVNVNMEENIVINVVPLFTDLLSELKLISDASLAEPICFVVNGFNRTDRPIESCLKLLILSMIQSSLAREEREPVINMWNIDVSSNVTFVRLQSRYCILEVALVKEPRMTDNCIIVSEIVERIMVKRVLIKDLVNVVMKVNWSMGKQMNGRQLESCIQLMRRRPSQRVQRKMERLRGSLPPHVKRYRDVRPFRSAQWMRLQEISVNRIKSISQGKSQRNACSERSDQKVVLGAKAIAIPYPIPMKQRKESKNGTKLTRKVNISTKDIKDYISFEKNEVTFEMLEVSKVELQCVGTLIEYKDCTRERVLNQFHRKCEIKIDGNRLKRKAHTKYSTMQNY